MKDSTALQVIEQLQGEMYENAGIDTNAVRQTIATNRYRIRPSGQASKRSGPSVAQEWHKGSGANEDRSSENLKRQDELSERFHTTSLQDPVILGALATHFHEHHRNIALQYPQTPSLDNILLASAPIGQQNAFAASFSDNTHAILFLDSLRFLPGNFLAAVLKVVFQEEHGLITALTEEREIERQVSKNFALLAECAKMAITDATQDGIVYASDTAAELMRGPELSPQSYPFVMARSGLHGFISAHELGHLALRHPQSIQSLEYTPTKFAKGIYEQILLEKFGTRDGYKEFRKNNRLLSFLFEFNQTMEHEADIIGISGVLEHSRELTVQQSTGEVDPSTLHTNMLFSVTGVFTFFCLLEFYEKLFAYLEGSTDFRATNFQDDHGPDMSGLSELRSHPKACWRNTVLRSYLNANGMHQDFQKIARTIRIVFASTWQETRTWLVREYGSNLPSVASKWKYRVELPAPAVGIINEGYITTKCDD